MSLREVFIAAHLIGLCMSLLVAVKADYLLIRSLLLETRFEFQEPLRLRAGFALLWISGIGLLVFYQITAPEQLLNPKLWAKLLIVLIASINGLWIEKRLIPHPIRSATVIPAVAVSLTSWTFAFVLGVGRSANFAVPFERIMAVFLCAAGAVTALGFAGQAVFNSRWVSRSFRPMRSS